MARTKNNTQNNTKHVEHQDATDIKKIIIFFVCFFRIFYYYYFFIIS